jgi:hypothetical protein
MTAWITSRTAKIMLQRANSHLFSFLDAQQKGSSELLPLGIATSALRV